MKTNKALYNELFDKIRELSGIGIWTVDLAKEEVIWDLETKKIHEVPSDFVPELAKGIEFYKEGESRDKITELVGAMIEKGTPFDTKLQIVTATGKERWVRAIAFPFIQEEKVTGFYGTFQDINSEVTESTELEEFKERFSLAAEAGKVGIWDWDVTNNILKWDDQMFKLYGVKEEDFSGAYEAWQSGLHKEDKEFGDQQIELALNGKKEFDIEFRVVWPNNQTRHIRGIGHVLRDPQGKPIRMLGTNWDITEEKTMRTELEKKNKELDKLAKKLQQSNEQLEEFAYITSHDLKSPIRNMANLASFILEDNEEKMDEDGIEMLKEIKTQAARMTNLVDDLLIYSRVDKMDIVRSKTDLGELVKDAVELLALPENVEVIIEDLPQLNVDGVKIRQVFNNLITNGVKYNNSDQKIITISATDCFLKIQDNGIGIDKKHKEKVFAFFSRLHGKSDFGGGTGAGMAIVKKVLDRHKATIDFESEIGKGTTFTIDFSECKV